jgi:hypothetical protein
MPWKKQNCWNSKYMANMDFERELSPLEFLPNAAIVEDLY